MSQDKLANCLFLIRIRDGESHLAVFRITNVTDGRAIALFISANRARMLRHVLAFDIKVALSVEDNGPFNSATSHRARRSRNEGSGTAHKPS